MSTQPVRAPREAVAFDRLFHVALWAFVASMAFSVGGSLLLMLVPSTVGLFGPFLAELVLAPTWTYMALLPVLPVLMYTPVLGWRRMALFVVLGSVIGGASELLGTQVGIPFGAYEYTHWLGAKIGGHVPYFIPLSWFAMSIVSLDLARRVTSSRRARVFVATVFMVLWDVSLDPAMNGAGARDGSGAPVGGVDMFWFYPEGGFYYGMPLSNWIGWFLVSLVIMLAYEAAGGLPRSSRWAPLVYALNCAFPLALLLLYGLFVPFSIGLVATSIPLLAVRYYGLPLKSTDRRSTLWTSL